MYSGLLRVLSTLSCKTDHIQCRTSYNPFSSSQKSASLQVSHTAPRTPNSNCVYMLLVHMLTDLGLDPQDSLQPISRWNTDPLVVKLEAKCEKFKIMFLPRLFSNPPAPLLLSLNFLTTLLPTGCKVSRPFFFSVLRLGVFTSVKFIWGRLKEHFSIGSPKLSSRNEVGGYMEKAFSPG